MEHISKAFRALMARWPKLVYGQKPSYRELTRLQTENVSASTATDRFFGKIIDGPEFIAPKRIAVGPSFHSSEQMLRYHQRADWQQTDPRIQQFAAYLIEALRRRNIPMYVHAAFRTEKEQNDAFRRGVSNQRYPRAAHCQGKAIDVVHARYHWDLTRQEWAMIGKIGQDIANKLNLPIEWGGHWQSPWDPAHWQLADWDHLPLMLEAGSHVHFTPRKLLKHFPI